MAIFVERELTARRGRKRATLRIRIRAPYEERGHWRCAHELVVDGEPRDAASPAAGADSLQALVLALGMVVFALEQFENETGLQIERWSWHDIWPLRPRVTLPGTRARAAEMRALERELAAAGKQFSARTAATPRARAPRAKAASPRAPRRPRSSPRAS